MALLGPFGKILNLSSYTAINSPDSEWGNPLHASLGPALGEKNVKFVPTVDILDATDDSGIADALVAAEEAGFAVLMPFTLGLNDPTSWLVSVA